MTAPAKLSEIWVFLAQSPLLWLSLTLIAYLGALWLHQRSGSRPLVNPVLVSVVAIVGVLLITRTPYDTYFEGAGTVPQRPAAPDRRRLPVVAVDHRGTASRGGAGHFVGADADAAPDDLAGVFNSLKSLLRPAPAP